MHGRAAMAQQLLDAGADRGRKTKRSGATALDKARQLGHDAVVRVLLG